MSLQNWLDNKWIRKHQTPERTLAHYRTIQALPLILGKDREKDINYLDACRIKRNKVEYDYSGGSTHLEADELIKFTKELKTTVINWLWDNYPELLK